MKTALITGGSMGIGYELSKLFAADGYRLLWVSKSREELDQGAEKFRRDFPNAELFTLEKDLSLTSSAAEVYEWAKTIANIDVLVNNAGYGSYGFLHDIELQKEIAMLNLNMINVYLLTRFFLKDMIARNEGRIMNLSSNAALQPVPLMSAYAATKAFVKHFSQSLNDELRYRRSNVTVTTVCPPATSGTGFQHTANMEEVKTFNSILTSTPAEVAYYAYKGTMEGKELVLAGKYLKNLSWLYKLLPTFVIKMLLKQELKKNN